MQNIPDADGDEAARNEAQLARVTRLIRLITAMKTNPRQTPEHLYRMPGISKSQFFRDKSRLDKALGFKVKFHRAKGPYAVVADPYLPIINLTLSEAFALILAALRQARVEMRGGPYRSGA